MDLRKLPLPHTNIKKIRPEIILQLMLLPKVQGATAKVIAYLWQKQLEAGGGWTSTLTIEDICKGTKLRRSSAYNGINQLKELGRLKEKFISRGNNQYSLFFPKPKVRFSPERKLNLKKPS